MRQTSLSFPASSFLPFLKTGVTFAFLQALGTSLPYPMGLYKQIYEEAEVCSHEVQGCALALLPPSLQDSVLKNSTVPVSLMTFRMRHLTLQYSAARVFLAQTCLTSCRPSVFSPPKAKRQLFPESHPVLTRAESALLPMKLKRPSTFALLHKKPGSNKRSGLTLLGVLRQTELITPWTDCVAAQEHRGTGKGHGAVGSLLVLCPVTLGTVTVQKSGHSQQAEFCFPTAAAVSAWSPPWNTSVFN